jgi:tetratricopeptide (TPR) repeat protein
MKIQSRLFWLVFLLLATTQLSALAQTDVTNLVEQGVVKFDSGDLDGASADFNKAIELKPDYARPFAGRGRAKRDKGDLDGALADFNKAIELNPDFQLCARDEKPLLAIVDLAGGDAVCGAIAALKAAAATDHIPVIAFAAEDANPAMEAARRAGAELAVSEAAINSHLPELLNQALHIE